MGARLVDRRSLLEAIARGYAETHVRVEGGGVGPRCSSCGATAGPFLEVEGAFRLRMCGDCQVARRGSATAAPTTQAATGEPAELLADHDPGRP
jgi:hypothetical protein